MDYEEEAEIGAEGTKLAPAPNSRLSLCSRSCVLACLKKKKKEEKRRKREKKKIPLSYETAVFVVFSSGGEKLCDPRSYIMPLIANKVAGGAREGEVFATLVGD